MSESKRVGNQIGDARIAEKTVANSAIKIFFNSLRAVFLNEQLLAWQQIRPAPLCIREHLVALDEPLKNWRGQRVCEVKGDKVKPTVFFPMGESAVVANSHFAEAGLYSTVQGKSICAS
jgi:hypothetical protein